MAAAKSDPRNKRTRAAKGESVYTEWFQLLLTPKQKKDVKEIAKDRGLTQSEWVRRAIDTYTVKHNSRKKASK
jgi:hypothetical protein